VDNDLKRGLVDRLKQVGAYDVRIADPAVGYEHALPGQHPLDLWQPCRSVVVFAVACSPRTNNTYLGAHAPWPGKRNVGPVPDYLRSSERAVYRLTWLFVNSVRLRGMEVLQAQGHSFTFLQPQLKLSAFEAGIGVYGRSGVILHPVLGNRLRLGAILTDAALEPDGCLEGFEPCVDCDLCIRSCPAQAYDPSKPYPQSWSRATCTARRAEFAEQGLYCHNCFAVCPAGKLADEELLRFEEARSVFRRAAD
jgi:ferredoxin